MYILREIHPHEDIQQECRYIIDQNYREKFKATQINNYLT